MVIQRVNTPDSDPYSIILSKDEFLHLYGVVCAVLYEDNSDKFLVELEKLMIDLL